MSLWVSISLITRFKIIVCLADGSIERSGGVSLERSFRTRDWSGTVRPVFLNRTRLATLVALPWNFVCPILCHLWIMWVHENVLLSNCKLHHRMCYCCRALDRLMQVLEMSLFWWTTVVKLCTFRIFEYTFCQCGPMGSCGGVITTIDVRAEFVWTVDALVALWLNFLENVRLLWS